MENLFSADEDYELWMLLAHTRYAVLKARSKELHRYHISTSQAGVLFILEAMDNNATVGQIARWTMREPHSVSSVLNRMKKQGLVKRVSDLQTRNPARFILTKKGRKAYYQAAKRDSIHQIISTLSQEERQQLRLCLQILRDKAVQIVRIEGVMPFPPSR